MMAHTPTETARATRTLSIFIVAGEESGDKLGAALMRAVVARTDGAVRFTGVGGHDMVACGLQSLASCAHAWCIPCG